MADDASHLMEEIGYMPSALELRFKEDDAIDWGDVAGRLSEADGAGRRGGPRAIYRIWKRCKDGDEHPVILSGMGSSYFAPSRVWERIAQPHSRAYSRLASEVTDEEINAAGGFILLSNSGQTAETVGLARRAAERGKPIVAITTYSDSPLAAAARSGRGGLVIPTVCGPERAVQATKSVADMMDVVARIGAALVGESVSKAALYGRGEEWLLDKLGFNSEIHGIGGDRELAGLLEDAEALLVSGSVIHEEIALKGNEMLRIPATPYAGTGVLHGPLAIAGKGAVAFVPEPYALICNGRDYSGRLTEISASSGMPVISIGCDGPGMHAVGDYSGLGRLGGEIARLHRAYLVMAQAGEAKPGNVDEPPNLTKVATTL